MVDKSTDQIKESVHLGVIASIFIIFGLLGLATSWLYNGETKRVTSYSSKPDWKNGKASFELGPIQVKEDNTSYIAKVKADVPVQNWSYVEGNLLDSNKRYLFAFGKELWHEQGRDSEGYYWREQDVSYEIDFTVPKKGTYYIKFNASQSNRGDSYISVNLHEKRGSGIPHLIYGIFVLLAGIVLNEIRNRTIIKLIT